MDKYFYLTSAFADLRSLRASTPTSPLANPSFQLGVKYAAERVAAHLALVDACFDVDQFLRDAGVKS